LHGDGEEFRRRSGRQARHQYPLFFVLVEGRRVGAEGHHMPEADTRLASRQARSAAEIRSTTSMP
jgi:hypothetical protein